MVKVAECIDRGELLGLYEFLDAFNYVLLPLESVFDSLLFPGNVRGNFGFDYLSELIDVYHADLVGVHQGKYLLYDRVVELDEGVDTLAKLSNRQHTISVGVESIK